MALFVLIASLGLSRWSFERGFRDYISQREQSRMEVVRDALATEYRTSGDSWESVTPLRFAELVSSSFPGSVRDVARNSLAPAEGLPPGRSPRPGPGESRGERPPPYPADGGPGRPPPVGPSNEGPGPGQPVARRGPPTALFDTNGQQVAGPDLDAVHGELFRMPIIVAGTTVGELKSALQINVGSPQDTAFAAEQLKAAWVIGFIAMVLAAILSILLARGLLAPVRRMMSNVARLSSGDYSARLCESRNDELGQLMGNLDHLGKTLEADRSARQRWLADISHELRTPLTVLSGELEALKDGVRKFDADELDSLDDEVRRLRFLIDDLHDLSVSDLGDLRYSLMTLDLADCIESAVGAAQKRARDNGLELAIRHTEPALINGDERRIDQLFQNLLANSIAYTDAPGRIEVSISRTQESIIVELSDTAPGADADADEYEHLFEPLYRREASRNRRTGGTGLGLAICRNIVEAHRGTITAAPSALGGLTVRVVIPAANETLT